MPGFEEDDIDIRLGDDGLTIRAEAQEKEDGEESYRSFFRRISLPAGINADDVRADYHSGVLELHVPKPRTARSHSIKLQSHQGGAGRSESLSKGEVTGKEKTETHGKEKSRSEGKSAEGKSGEGKSGEGKSGEGKSAGAEKSKDAE
jgi:hypothetical protein